MTEKANSFCFIRQLFYFFKYKLVSIIIIPETVNEILSKLHNKKLYHLESMSIRIIIINYNGIITRNDCPTFNARNDCRFSADSCFFFNTANELRTDYTFMNEFIS